MKRGLLGLTLLLALVPLACGGGEALSPEAAVAEAATKTSDAGTSRLSFDATMSGPGLPQAVSFTGTGAFDYAARRGRFTYDLGELIPGGGAIEVVMDGLVLYLRFPDELSSDLPEGKAWLKLDLAAAGEAAGIDIGALSQLNQTDPSQFLSYLRGATDGIETVGEEEVRGASTTHYRGRVDLRKAAEEATRDAPAETREAVRESIENVIELTGTSTMPVDVWIDGEGRARRFAFDFDMKMPGEMGKAHMEMTMELFDFGTNVEVEPPPADEVVDLGELFKSQGA